MTTHALPPPPADLFDGQMLANRDGDAIVSPIPLHFWERGPGDTPRVAKPYKLVLRDGSQVRITHRMPWALGRVEGMTRSAALKAIYGVLLHPRSWSRTGVHWPRVTDPRKAKIIVNIVPEGETVCGANASGCYSWGGGRTPWAEVEAQYVANPGAFAMILGMELCGHGTFSVHDAYINHPGFIGSMGTWAAARQVGWFPTRQEIEAARTWLRGETPPALIHDH